MNGKEEILIKIISQPVGTLVGTLIVLFITELIFRRRVKFHIVMVRNCTRRRVSEKLIKIRVAQMSLDIPEMLGCKLRNLGNIPQRGMDRNKRLSRLFLPNHLKINPLHLDMESEFCWQKLKRT